MSVESSPSTAADQNQAHATQPAFISVLMPVRNEARSIAHILSQLVAQQYDPHRFEVLVIDGQSTDDTPAIVSQFAQNHHNIRLLSNPRRWSSAARNIGIRHARGDILVIVDGHCELDDQHYLHKLAAAFERSGADCLGRPQPLDVSHATSLQRAIAAARSSRLGHHPDSFVYATHEQFVPAVSVAVAYRRSLFDTVGFFDETFDACEDVDFNHRIDEVGLRCFFTPQVAVRYLPRDTLPKLFRQLVRYGRGRIRLLRKHPDTLTLKTLVPGLFVLGCIAGLGLSWVSSWLAALYLGVLSFYLLVVLGTSLAIAARRRDLTILPWLPLVFFTIHTSAGTGLLLEAFAGLRPRGRLRPAPNPQPSTPDIAGSAK